MNEKYENDLSWRSTQLKFELTFHNGLKILSQNIYSNEKWMNEEYENNLSWRSTKKVWTDFP